MYEAWCARDVAALQAAVQHAPLLAIPELRYAVLEARNRLWAPRLNELTGSANTLVAAGALHLCLPGNAMMCAGLEAISLD